MRGLLFALSLALASLTLASPARAQQSACVSIEDDAQRLACYDAANGRTPRAAPGLGSHAERNLLPLPDFSRGDDTARPPVQYQVARIERGSDGQVYLAMTNREIWAVRGHPRQLPQPGTQVSIQRRYVGVFLLSYASGEAFEVRKQS